MQQIIRVLPIGQDLESAALSTGEIRSIYVNNPSGSWLQVFPTYDFIAPYTLGFARVFEGTLASVTIRFVNGPAGQLSTDLGDPVTVILYDQPISPSSGVPFVSTSAETLGVTLAAPVPLSTGLSGTLLSPAATNRIRILQIAATLGGFPSSPLTQGRSAVTWSLSGVVFIVGRVTPTSPHNALVFPDGMDMGLGQQVNYAMAADFCNSHIVINVLYRLI